MQYKFTFGISAHVMSSKGFVREHGESLSNGVYFLKMVQNNEVQQVIKLVKNF